MSTIMESLWAAANRESTEIADMRKDAERYRWLRAQHWSTSRLAVVCDPRSSIKLGYFAPSEALLDHEIDKYMDLERSET